MSVGVDRLSLPVTNTSTFSLIVTEKEPVRHFTSQATKDKKRQEKAIFQNVSRRMFNSGVRAPLLADIPPNSNFQIDIVESRQSSKVQRLLLSRGKDSSRSCMSSLQSFPNTKSIKFLLPDGSFKQESQIGHGGKSKAKRDEAWERWKEQMAKTRDARDILYRNTYFPVQQNIRYHTCSLPRIAPQRPWTVAETSQGKSMVLENQETENLVERSIVPQPETRRFDLMQIKGLQRQDTMDSNASDGYFEVRKIKSNGEFIKGNATNYSANVRQPSDLNHRYDLIRQRRNERPLKRENIHYRPVNVSQRCPPHLQRNFMMMERDQKSVEAYKEYVEAMKQRGIEGRNAEFVNDQDNSSASHYGFENRMLQSVIDVNQPQEVKDAVVQDRKSSMITNDKNSIVIQIKSTWDERLQDKQTDDGLSHGCPTNSPIPEHRNDDCVAQNEDELRIRVQDT